MTRLGALALLVLAVGAAAQQGPQQRLRHVPLDSCLQEAYFLARSAPLETVRRSVGERFIEIRPDRRVHVEIVGPEGAAAMPRVFVAPFGGIADTRWRNRLDAWVPLDALFELALSLPPGHRVVRASAGDPDQVAGEGPAAIGSDGYRNGGANGAGVVIAVIDEGYTGLSAARANGDAPSLASSTLINYTPSAFESTSNHGTGCVEAAFDHCPGATWRLYKTDSLADLGTAVSDAIANGVDVITHSLSRYNQGWADDTGAACAAAQQAANAGITFFTSAGNRALQHWQGTFNPGGGSTSWHDFAAGDEALAIQLAAGQGASIYLSWNTGAGSADYDLHLYDVTLTTLIASSTNGGNTFEEVWVTNTGTGVATANVVVTKAGGANLEFELFGHGGGTWEHIVSQGSTTSPSNSTHARVISVGAVDWSDFPSPKGTAGILMGYSSRGPSNSGMVLPDLVGPTGTAGFTFPGANGGFTGTSCATPNAAGAACAFWSSVLPFEEAAVRWLYREQSQLRRDWGSAGPDSLYGSGGASLAPFAPGTTWLARGYGNTGNLSSGPLYTLAAAQTAATTNGRILALPGSYPEAPIVLSKALVVDGFEGSAVLGD